MTESTKGNEPCKCELCGKHIDVNFCSKKCALDFNRIERAHSNE